MAAEQGNKYAEKYEENTARKLFMKGLQYAKSNDDCLSIQDVIIHIDISHSTFYNLCEKFEVLDNIKKDMNDAVIARVNRNALKNKYNSTAAIWRMKQLGEKDVKEHDFPNALTLITSEKSKKKIDHIGDD